MPIASDRFSSLPNEIMGIILSKVPIREEVRSSILSKRWRFLYTQIPQLILSPYLLLGSVTSDPLSIVMAENAIQHSAIAFLGSRGLSSFRRHYTHSHPSKWVQYAYDRNVQHVHLRYSMVQEFPPPVLFFCAHLTTLTLNTFILSHIPIHSSGINHLTNCTFKNIQLTDDSLAWFASHCPVLQELEIRYCTGLRKPIISSPNIMLLVVLVWDGIENLTVNCPKIRSIEVCEVDDLRVNGVFFHELSVGVVALEMQGEINVIGLEIDSTFGVDNDKFSAQRFAEIVGSFKALKKLGIHICPLLETENEMVVPLITLLQGLPHLECLRLSGLFRLELGRDRIPPSCSPLLGNLRYMMVEINEFDDGDKEMAVVGCLLQRAAALEDLRFELPEKYEEAQYTRFLARRRWVQTKLPRFGMSF